MSQQLINLNEDLQQLQASGLSIQIIANHLVVHGVPYVNSKGQIAYGELISTLNRTGDKVLPPESHVTMWRGDHPCNPVGGKLDKIANSSGRMNLGGELCADHRFSSKPKSGQYRDYFEKMMAYVAIISGPARIRDETVTAMSGIVFPDATEATVFQYPETSSSRAGIQVITEKLQGHKIAIVGLGGTGSYVLDYLAKTPVAEILLMDGDTFCQHNAFRSPGAPDHAEFVALRKKVDYFSNIYSRMHKNIIAKPCFLSDGNLSLLDDSDFVFLCVDKASVKAPIMAYLRAQKIGFIDVGMGLEMIDEKLMGTVRLTTVTPEKCDHADKHISVNDNEADAVYNQNIQIAELNALNASLAVVKWKKLVGFFHDFDREHSSQYAIDGNILFNRDNAS